MKNKTPTFKSKVGAKGKIRPYVPSPSREGCGVVMMIGRSPGFSDLDRLPIQPLADSDLSGQIQCRIQSASELQLRGSFRISRNSLIPTLVGITNISDDKEQNS